MDDGGVIGANNWKYILTIKPNSSAIDTISSFQFAKLAKTTGGSGAYIKADNLKAYRINDNLTSASIAFTTDGTATFTNLTGKTAVYPKITMLNNNTNVSKTADVIVALYNSSNTLQAVNYATKTIGTGVTSTVINNMGLTGLTSIPAGWYAKAFVWNGVTSMKPIATTPGYVLAQ
jgi:hypothetical protein